MLMEANHSTICKFSEQNYLYKKVEENMADLILWALENPTKPSLVPLAETQHRSISDAVHQHAPTASHSGAEGHESRLAFRSQSAYNLTSHYATSTTSGDDVLSHSYLKSSYLSLPVLKYFTSKTTAPHSKFQLHIELSVSWSDLWYYSLR